MPYWSASGGVMTATTQRVPREWGELGMSLHDLGIRATIELGQSPYVATELPDGRALVITRIHYRNESRWAATVYSANGIRGDVLHPPAETVDELCGFIAGVMWR